jgi:hypothetical protein
MADRIPWETAERASRVFSVALIPVVLAVVGYYANQSLEQTKVKDELLKKATQVIFEKADPMIGDETSFEGRRAYRKHWVEIYNSLAEQKLSDSFIAIMMEQDTLKDENKDLFHLTNMPGMMAKNDGTEPPGSTNENEMGHGWVAIGRLDSKRYSDRNFDVPDKALGPNGKLKPGETIQSRWSVTLRKNARNIEDRKGYTGTSRGLLWGGECVRVIDSAVDGRAQTWAFIEIVQCPQVPDPIPPWVEAGIGFPMP